MGSKTTGTTTSRSRARVGRKLRRGLEKMSTREAQIIRMRRGISEPATAEVGRPASACSSELTARLLELEAEVISRVRAGSRSANPVKKKIVRALKKRS